MDIIFDGNHSDKEASESILSVIKLFKERYHIDAFREMHLSVTLVDASGDDVELVDSQTNEPYRTFEVYRDKEACSVARPQNRLATRQHLKLIVDNTVKNR